MCYCCKYGHVDCRTCGAGNRSGRIATVDNCDLKRPIQHETSSTILCAYRSVLDCCSGDGSCAWWCLHGDDLLEMDILDKLACCGHDVLHAAIPIRCA